MKEDFSHSVHTDEFENEVIRRDLLEVLEILQARGIHQLRVLFGYGWAMRMHDWKEVIRSSEELLKEIAQAEEQEFGYLGSDDLSLIFDECVLKYCHHGDVHLSYDAEENLVLELLNHWQSNGWVLH